MRGEEGRVGVVVVFAEKKIGLLFLLMVASVRGGSDLVARPVVFAVSAAMRHSHLLIMAQLAPGGHW